jgi:hypothetical protein
MKTCLAIATALSALISAGTARAGTPSYEGNWPITISNAQFYDGTYCLKLSGSTSGGAELTGQMGNLYGNFQVFGRTLIAIVPLQSNGFNLGEEFVLPARNGKLARGTYVEDGDGEIANSGVAKVGKENGC